MLGLLLLTPIFTTDLERNEDEALAAGTRSCSTATSRRSTRSALPATCSSPSTRPKSRRVLDVEAVVDHRDDPAYAELGSALQDQLDRAATNAFSRSFLAAALLGLLALITDRARETGRERLMRAIA